MIYRILLGLILAVTAAMPVMAKDAYFTPAVGEVFDGSDGLERAVVTEDGALQLFSYTGDMLDGFPLYIENEVVATSPVIADIAGDAQKEIIFASRDEDNNFTLRVYNGAGESVGSLPITGRVYTDPIAVAGLTSAKKDIMVYDLNRVLKRYSFENNQLQENGIAGFPSYGGITAGADGEVVYVTLPGQRQISVLTADRENTRWNTLRTLNVNAQVAHAIVEGSDGYLYGTDLQDNVIAVHKETGVSKVGFPVALGASPVSSLTLSDVNDAHAGPELLATLSNGKVQVISTSGNLVEQKGKQQFTGHSVAVDDVAEGTIFQRLSSGTIGVMSDVQQSISSILSRLRNVLVQRTPEIVMSIDGDEITSVHTYDFGKLVIGESAAFTITLTNDGTGDIVLDGNTPVSLAGGNPEQFAITEQPTRIVQPGQSTQIGVSFTPVIDGAYDAVLQFGHNDTDENPVAITLTGSGFTNLINDWDMSDAGMAAWPVYGNPDIYEKLGTGPHNTRMHINTTGGGGGGMQQLDVPVEAGQWYTFGFWYQTGVGEFRPRLGINSSFRDFERRLETLPENHLNNYYERTFQVPEDYVDGFRVVIASKNVDGQIDKVYVTPTVAPGLVMDATMDKEHIAYWKPYGEPHRIEKHTDGDNQYLHVEEVSGGAGVQQTHINVEPGRTYNVSFRYQFPEGERLRTVLNLASLGGNTDLDGIYQNLAKTAPGEWKWYQRQITIPEGNTDDLRIYWAMRTGAGAHTSFNLDDVTVEEVDATLVQDGDMEAIHTASWAPYGVPDVLEKRVEAGNDYLYVEETNGGAGVQQMNVPVEPGQRYVLRFRYKFEQGERLRPTLNIRGIGGKQSDVEGLYQNIRRTSNGEWGWYERTFDVPAEARNPLTIRFAMRSGSGATGWFALDDMSLELASNDIISDGDMEANQVAAWSDYGPIDVKEKRAEAHAGVQSLYVERDPNYAQSLGVQQTGLSVEPNTQYRLSFWYKGNTMVIPRLGNGSSNEDYEGGRSHLAPQADWQRYERTFTTPADLEEFRFVLAVEKTFYNLQNHGPYQELFTTADNQFFVDGVQMNNLAPADFEPVSPATPHVYIDDVLIEAL